MDSARIVLLTLAAAVAPIIAMAGCSSSEDNDQTPAACKVSVAEYRSALAAAPGEVTLGDGTLISECLVPEQTGGDLAAVGKELVATATALNEEARQNPTGAASVQLGYLIGAIERGAEGIHADLVRRVNSAARFSPEGLLPAEFERTFGTGYSAGLEGG